MFRWKRRGPADPLDTTLLHWSPHDPLTVRGLLNGGVAVFGRSGSGKTSSSGKALGRAIVAYPNSGGLILLPKRQDLAMWRAIFADYGRSDDLIVFGSLESKWRFNLLDFVCANGGQTRDITRCIRTIGESLGAGDSRGGGENGDFFAKQEQRMIYNAVEAVKLASERITAPKLQQFITTAAYSSQQIASDEWKAGFHNQCLKAAFKRTKTSIESHDYRLVEDYWLGEFPMMADKTRSGILAGVIGNFHGLNTGRVRELMSTTTTVSPADQSKGKWVLVNQSQAEYGDEGSAVNTGWKFATQWHNLRRPTGPGTPINVIWCDEAQQVVNSFDAHYLAQCRSHLACMVYLTQSLPSYYSALKGESGRQEAEALLSNFHHKAFHAVGDPQTAEWASSLVGKSLQTFVGGSSQECGDAFDAMLGRSHYTGSFSEHYENILQPNVFLSGLRTGGPANGLIADAILVRSGEPFANGQSYLHCSFSQKG